MSLDIDARYTPRSTPADANFPTGQVKNETTPGADDGTPLDKDFANDLIGARDSLLDAAGVAATGAIDNVALSQLLESINTINALAWRLDVISESPTQITLQLENRTKRSNITPLYTPMFFKVGGTAINSGSTLTLEVDGGPNEATTTPFILDAGTVYSVSRFDGGVLKVNSAESVLGTTDDKVRNNLQLDARYLIGSEGGGASQFNDNAANLAVFYTQSQIDGLTALADQSEAEGGVENTKSMTSLRVKQSINVNGRSPVSIWTGSDTTITDAEILADTGFVVIPGTYMLVDTGANNQHVVTVFDLSMASTNSTQMGNSNPITHRTARYNSAGSFNLEAYQDGIAIAFETVTEIRFIPL